MALNTAVLFIIFKRPETTSRVFEVIRKAKPQRLYISANSARADNSEEFLKCDQTRQIVETIDWDCEVKRFYRTEHLPVQISITSAINWFFENEEEGIILEDDCLPDITFFRFCEELLIKYRNDTRISTIAGPNTQFGNCRGDYSYYFSHQGHSWGWATWRRFWTGFDLNMKLWPEIRDGKYLEDIFENKMVLKYWYLTFGRHYTQTTTWDYQLAFYGFINNFLNIIPTKNLISNIGHGLAAEHTKFEGPYSNMKIDPMDFPLQHPPFIVRDKKADDFREMKLFSYRESPNILHYLLRKVKRIFRRNSA